jgi:hypothetical protein
MPHFYVLLQIPFVFCSMWAIGASELRLLATFHLHVIVQWLFPIIWLAALLTNKSVIYRSQRGITMNSSYWRIWWLTHAFGWKPRFPKLVKLCYSLERLTKQLKDIKCLTSCWLIINPWYHSCKIAMIQLPNSCMLLY